jgi:Holliday junction resolvase
VVDGVEQGKEVDLVAINGVMICVFALRGNHERRVIIRRQAGLNLNDFSNVRNRCTKLSLNHIETDVSLQVFAMQPDSRRTAPETIRSQKKKLKFFKAMKSRVLFQTCLGICC